MLLMLEERKEKKSGRRDSIHFVYLPLVAHEEGDRRYS